MAKATKADWLIPAGLIVLSAVPVIAGTARLAQLSGGAAISPENARFFAAPLPVVLTSRASRFTPSSAHFSSHPASGVGVPAGTAAAARCWSWPDSSRRCPASG